MEKNIYKKLFEVKKAWIKLQRDTKAYNYKYATLSQIQEKLNWEFEKQGLLVLHKIIDNKVQTMIIDFESDTSVNSEIPLTEWTKAQDKWSEITYYRRYNLLSLLDLEVEDDDWKKAQDSTKKKFFNYEDLVSTTEAWNTTIKDIQKVVEQDWYVVSSNAKKAIAHYINTGEIDKNLFFNKW